MLLIQLLTVEHVVIHIVSKDYIHGNLKDWIFKIHVKFENVKPASWKKDPRYYKISFYSKYIPMFNELVI